MVLTRFGKGGHRFYWFPRSRPRWTSIGTSSARVAGTRSIDGEQRDGVSHAGYANCTERSGWCAVRPWRKSTDPPEDH